MSNPGWEMRKGSAYWSSELNPDKSKSLDEGREAVFFQ